MQKSLKGSSQAALAFFLSHFGRLAAVGLMPVIVSALVSILVWWRIGDFLVIAFADGYGKKVAVDQALQVMLQKIWPQVVMLGFTTFVVQTWHFTRVARFWRFNAGHALTFTQGEFGSTAFLIFYQLALAVIGAAIYFALAAAVALFYLGLRAVLGDSQVTTILTGISGAAALCVFIYVMIRLFAGLAQVAWGKMPKATTDLWPLAKGETWSLVWRLAFLVAVMLLMSIVLNAVLIAPVMVPIPDTLLGTAAAPNQMVIDSLRAKLVPYAAASVLFGAVQTTFSAVYLSEICARLVKKYKP